MVNDALASAESTDTFVHGEDTDLLILLLGKTEARHYPITLVPHQKKTSKKKRKIWRIRDAQLAYGEMRCRRLLFTHPFTGCDTTARPMGVGKVSINTKMKNNVALCQSADTFLNPDASREEVIQAGDIAMRIIHGGSLSTTLGDLRYSEYKRRVLKGTQAVKAEVLPPTSGSTKHQSLRTYCQVMAWLGINLDPEQYGYKIVNGKLRGTITDLEPAPPELLKTIYCNCNTGCLRNNCSCKKVNLVCTELCGKCKGVSCENTILNL